MNNYDAWLIWDITEKCNLSCFGCAPDAEKIKSGEQIHNVNIPALMKTLEKTGKVFHISFSGGEPFLIPNIIETLVEITKKHFVSVMTNLTLKKVTEFAEKVNPQRVRYILASAHIEELNRTKTMDKYISHFLLCREKGFTINAQEVAYPFISGKVKEYTIFFADNGIKLGFNPFRGKCDHRRFPEEYTEEEKKIFSFGNDISNDISIFYQYGKTCNAGFNTGIILPDGTVKPCFFINQILGNIYDGFVFNDHLVTCPYKFCECPQNIFDKYLYNAALKKSKKTKRLFAGNKEKEEIKIHHHVKKYINSDYCLITKDINQYNLRGLKQWIDALGGKIYTDVDVLSGLRGKVYKNILVHLSKGDSSLVRQIRNKIGKHSNTKIIGIIDSPVEQWKKELNDMNQLIFNLKNIDFIVVTEPYSINALKAITIKKIYEIPHPLDMKKIQTFHTPKRKDIISVLVHDHAYNIYIPHFAVRNNGMEIRLLEYNRMLDKNVSVTETLYKELCPNTNFLKVLEQMGESRLIFESETYHTSGILTAAAAGLGIPVVGSDRVESLRRCFPYTAVDPYDTEKARDLIYRVLNDSSFRNKVIQNAVNNADFYSYENFRKRLDNMLAENRKDGTESLDVAKSAGSGVNIKKENVKNSKDWDINIKEYNFKSNPEGKINICPQPFFKKQRSGWRYAVNALCDLHNDDGVLFDGFLENTFAWKFNEFREKGKIPYKRRWIGIFHNPQNMPEFIYYETSIQVILNKPEFIESLKSCAGFISLSNYHAEFLCKQTGKPVSVLYHPTDTEVPLFDFYKFLTNEKKKIVTIGWWLRKLNSIFLLPLDIKSNYKKIRLLPYSDKNDPVKKSIDTFIEQEKKIYNIVYDEKYYSNTETCTYLSHQEYDDLLTYNIVFLDLYDANANNSVVECIARCTPVLINPVPAVVEYLGKEYPFYFSNLEEAAFKAQNIDLVKKTFEYLKAWPVRKKITGRYFCESFRNSEVYRQL